MTDQREKRSHVRVKTDLEFVWIGEDTATYGLRSNAVKWAATWSKRDRRKAPF